MASLNQRLTVLEGRIPTQPIIGGALHIDQLATNLTRWVVGWEILSQTMDAEHVALVEAEVPDWWTWVSHRGRAWLTFHFGQFSARSNLAYQVSRMIADAAHGRHRGPFTLPAEVASIYVVDERASPNDDCGDCGYVLPTHTGWSNVRGGHGGTRLDAAHDYFSVCPLCGGAADCNLYFRMIGQPAPTYRLPDARLETVRREVIQHLETIETEYVIPECERIDRCP